MLSLQQIAQYHADGFLVVPGVIDAATIDALRAATERIVDGAAHVDTHDAVYDLEPGHTRAAPRVRRIKNPERVDPAFAALARHPGITGCLQQLWDQRGVRFDIAKLNMKSAGYGSPVEWHQDWAFYPHTNDDVLAVGVMLDDTELENGPLLVIPGSHKGPTYDHHDPDGFFCGAIDPEVGGIDFDKAVPCTGPAGSISIHHARLLHGSAENQSNRPRRLLLYEFTAGDAWPLLGVNNLADFHDQLLTGTPSIQPRIAAAPVRMPLPPAPYQGSIYENQTTLKNRFFGKQKAVA